MTMMPSFEYEALDLAGRSKRGVVAAESPRQARRELRRLELTPVSISTPREKTGPRTKAPARVGAGDLVTMTRQLSVLVGAATPLEEALNAVALQTEKPGVRKRMLAVRERVLEGWRFADALAEDKKSFSDLYRAVVSAGETSGDLGGVLDRLATMLEKNRSMLNKAIASLIYPAALALVATGVVVALMVMVVPKIVEQFESFDARLPLVTRLVIGFSDFVMAFGVYIALLLIAGAIGFWQGMRNPKFKLSFDQWVLTVPLIGKLLRGLDGARFARTLATLFAGGSPLLDSLKGAQRTVSNSHIRERLEGAITQVREGGSLAQSLKRTEALPPMMTHMLAAGERSGAVPLMLDKAATQLEEEFDTATTVALRLLEPAIIIAMGAVVALIVVSIMLPILRLNSLAGA
jgi:general secretion pathway protein F